MKFRLIYEGKIQPRQRASLADIHCIRQAFHPQLKRLWDHEPLCNMKSEWLVAAGTTSNVYERIADVGGRKYVPIISTHLAAELDVIFLRQQARGQLIGDGGDIDNRLKTLFDALRVPSKAEVQQLGAATTADDQPMHCLLKDDSLIHRVNVETDRLLKDAQQHELMLIIQVRVVLTFASMDAIALIAD